MITPYYQNDSVTIYHGDCREILPDVGPVDLVLTDPPYGKMWTRGRNAIGLIKELNENDPTLWDRTIPSKEIFDMIRTKSRNQIIFGGNYFAHILPASNCWLVWDKLGDLSLGSQIPFAHCELLWTSFNKTVKKYTLRQQGFINDSSNIRVHPTQKPTELVSVILQDFSIASETILDPFMGSGTTLRAAKDLGRKAIGIEIEEKYCEIAAKRMAQGVLL